MITVPAPIDDTRMTVAARRFIDEFYPEVATAGGLVPALNAALRERGRPDEEMLPLSDPAGDTSVLLETQRGILTVYLALEERDFFLQVNDPGFTWVYGSTADIAALAEAIVKWRQGTPIDDFAHEFPFIELGEVAHTLERGDVVAAQWGQVLGADDYVAQHALLAALYARESLRWLLPTVTYSTVRLSFDRLGADQRYLMIDPAEGGRYRVRAYFQAQANYEAESLEHAVALVAQLVAAEV